MDWLSELFIHLCFIFKYFVNSFRVEGATGNVLNPKDISITEAGGVVLSDKDKIRLKRAYGCGSCGGHQYSRVGGIVTGEGSLTSPLCEWVLATDMGKGISIDIEVTFDD